MGILSKLQPLFIILAAFLGIVTGKLNPFIAEYAGNCIEIFLMAMLFFVFLPVNIKDITNSFIDLRFSVSALVINFIWTPLFIFILSKIFLQGSIDLQTGFIMLMVTPCTDWYLIFTGLSNGNVALGSSILPLNLILQIVLLPFYIWLFMGTAVSFDSMIIIRSIVFVLLIPLLAANIVKFIAGKINFRNTPAIPVKSDDIQFILLCLAIIAMFASQGSLLLDNIMVFFNLLPPLLLFFIVNFLLAFLVGKKLKLPYQNIIPLIFTTSARNSPVALVIAVISFPLRPIVSLVLLIGPLIELPVLALYSAILRHRRRPA